MVKLPWQKRATGGYTGKTFKIIKSKNKYSDIKKILKRYQGASSEDRKKIQKDYSLFGDQRDGLLIVIESDLVNLHNNLDVLLNARHQYVTANMQTFRDLQGEILRLMNALRDLNKVNIDEQQLSQLIVLFNEIIVAITTYGNILRKAPREVLESLIRTR